MNYNETLFDLFGFGSIIEEPEPGFPIGLRIYWLKPSLQHIFCVTGPPNPFGYQPIVLTSYPASTTPAFIGEIDGKIPPLSRNWENGFYYDDVENYIYSETEIKEYIKRADELIKQAAQKREEKPKEEKNNIRQTLIKEYPHLTPLTNQDDLKMLRKNIVAELKKHFPEQIFSVRKRDCTCIDIYWTNGVAYKAVDTVTKKFNDHTSDYLNEMSDHTPTAFTNLFGGIKYLSINREITDDIHQLIESIKEIYPNVDQPGYHSDLLRRIVLRTSFPMDATNFHIVRSNNLKGGIENSLDISYEVPQKKEKTVPLYTGKRSIKLRMVDYSEFSFAVYGDTYPVRKLLFDLGGSFKSGLKEGKGFLFDNDKREAVASFIESTSSPGHAT